MKLNDIANQLLDLGKRNRLLNYKDTGLKSIEILNKNLKDIYLNLTSNKDFSFMIIEPLLERYHKTIVDPMEEDIVSEYSALKVYDITHEACKPKELIAYKKGYKQDKVFKALMKEYKYSILEKGINSLYLTFNFVTYKEDNQIYKAPLLLIPVEFEKNKNGVYKIHAADDDIILNPTLDYYFNTYRHFDIPNYTETDFDYDVYMEEIKKVLPEDVIFEEGMSLGIYSFLKMNMYNDLMAHEKTVLSNRNIQTLLGNPSVSDIELEGKPLPVVSCDSSQFKAIELATKGKSFVLQGPPGSGKSQTITNIIASLIGNGRHVLFVSEKLQALQVVYENLRRAGLEDFAIELHSSKANKKAFIDELNRTANLPKYAVSNSAIETRDEYYKNKEFIESYVNALNEKAPNENITIYELFSEYISSPLEEMKYKITDIQKYKISDSIPTSRYLREYKDAMESLGYDYRKTVFYGFNDMNKSYLSYDMDKEFTKAIQYLIRLLDYKDKLNKYILINKKEIISLNDLYKIFAFIEDYNKLSINNSYYLDNEKNPYLLSLVEEYLNTPSTCKALTNYDKEILNIDIQSLYRTLKGYTGFFRILSGEYRSIKREILSYRNGKAKDEVLLKELKTLIEVKKNLVRRKEIRQEIKEYIPECTNENMKIISSELKIMASYLEIELLYKKEECINPLLDQLLSFKNYQVEDLEYRNLATKFDLSVLDFFNHPLSVILSHLKEMYIMKNKMEAYIRVLSTLNNIKESGFLNFLHEYLDLNKDLEYIDKIFHKTFLQNKVLYTLQSNPSLAGFSSNLFRDRVSDFIKLDEKILLLDRDYIVSKNSMNRPEDILLEGSKYQILAHEASKVRKQKPVRVLLSEIFDFALQIKPVFLMSPLSVSTYLTEDNIFDCVIFDEASQIFAQDAFGAIYRGKQCIIIGDSKQMPPSNFFGATSEDSDEEDYDSGIESILDMGSAYMSTSSLKWHYRSRSEELIAFSNKAFYDSSLITVPQAHQHEKGFGIDFEYVENGIYDTKTRTNLEEAKHIASMVIEHYKNSNKSLGVVAFSKVQAELIEDLVEKEVLKNPELSTYFSDEVNEPFFVKNLETVQGDERDRIIFSICYGYNSDGKFFQRFGPLNNVGGERRLNVAVTRSKYNITIVSSIKHTDIKEKNTESLGVKLLKEYLEFAENVELNKNYSDSDNGIVKDCKKFLEENNYEVFTNYGASSFKIPLAIKENGDFICAVMLDNHKENQNTSDAYHLEKLLLERQGWKYYKLLSAAWVTDKETEKKKLLDFLTEENEIKEKNEDIESFIEETDTSIESYFDTYIELPNDKLIHFYETHSLKYALTKMIEKEEPVHQEYLLKKAAIAMGKTRVTNVVKNEVAKSMPDNITTIGNTIFITPKNEVKLRLNSSRMLNEIPLEEIKDGLFNIVSISNGITVEGAYKSLIKLLGFSRLTEANRKMLDDAIVFLKLDGKIIQKGESLYI